MYLGNERPFSTSIHAGIYGDNRCYLETETYFHEKLKHNKPQGFCVKQINIQIPVTTEMWQDIRNINTFRRMK